MNSHRGYRPMSCFICKAQCWLSLLTVSHVHTVDRTTAGSCAFQWLFREYYHADSVQQSAVEPDCVGVSVSLYTFLYYFHKKSILCPVLGEDTNSARVL